MASAGEVPGVPSAAVNVAAPVILLVLVLIVAGLYFAGRVFGRGAKDARRGD